MQSFASFSLILLFWTSATFSKELVIDGKKFILPEIPYGLEKIIFFDKSGIRHRVLVFNNVRTEGGFLLKYEQIKLPDDGGFSYILKEKDMASIENLKNQEIHSEAQKLSMEAKMFCCNLDNVYLTNTILYFNITLSSKWKCRSDLLDKSLDISCSKE